MGITLFTDFYNALKTVGSDLMKLAELGQNEKQMYRDNLGDTFTMLNASLNIVIIRLGDILLEPSREEILKLGNTGEWYEVERDFRLCKNLRATLSKTKSIRGKVGNKLIKNWEALIEVMDHVFVTEAELADHISRSFWEICNEAEKITEGTPEFEHLLEKIRTFRDSLRKIRQDLILLEAGLYTEILP